MTAEFGAFKYGKVQYPLAPQAAGADLLAICDPAVAKLIDFFSSVLATYLEPALIGAAIGVSPIAEIVATSISVNPADVAKFDQLSFPLLAVWRKTSVKNQKTANWQQAIWKMGVAYILPPLSAEQAVKFHPALNAVGQILSNRLHYGFDPSYNSGERIFLDNDIAACKLVSSEIGRWDVDKGLDFHAWLGELEMTEQEMATTEGLQTLSGASFKISDESASPGNPVEVVNATI